mmetsp:Transcript_51045/g.121269  ORF Transcript_51045/g.121269 Transcript_51045/m.121269 type:complete len:200 (+) Transcript_51045:537-1136(+)
MLPVGVIQDWRAPARQAHQLLHLPPTLAESFGAHQLLAAVTSSASSSAGQLPRNCHPPPPPPLPLPLPLHPRRLLEWQRTLAAVAWVWRQRPSQPEKLDLSLAWCYSLQHQWLPRQGLPSDHLWLAAAPGSRYAAAGTSPALLGASASHHPGASSSLTVACPGDRSKLLEKRSLSAAACCGPAGPASLILGFASVPGHH